MSISFDKFLNWAESRFGDVKVRGDEILINSIFCEDYKHHLACNPSGGKHKISQGVYHCWKTNEGGSLISLVRQVDKCSYEEALETLGSVDTELFELEKKVNELFTPKKIEKKEIKLALPDATFWITELISSNPWRIAAEDYLIERGLPPKDFMVCTEGLYKNRIIIPYFDKDSNLIYWNARTLSDSKKIPKYLGPHKDCGVGKEDVLYAPYWPAPGSKIHVTEGEFDAKSLTLCGLPACAVAGKLMSDKQILMLLSYEIILCFDTDKTSKSIEGCFDSISPGKMAILEIGSKLKQEGSNVLFVRPPIQFKDWNEMLTKVGPNITRAYVEKNYKNFNNDTQLEQRLKN